MIGHRFLKAPPTRLRAGNVGRFYGAVNHNSLDSAIVLVSLPFEAVLRRVIGSPRGRRN